jgi:hypothetical protein
MAMDGPYQPRATMIRLLLLITIFVLLSDKYYDNTIDYIKEIPTKVSTWSESCL